MIRRFGLLLTVVASSGCFNFDTAYQAYCDAGRCTDGGATGGGGGTTTGGGGGTATGGGGGTVSCGAFMCPELDWKSTRRGVNWDLAPGLQAESLTRFDMYAAFDSSRPGQTSVYTQSLFQFRDAGVTDLDITSLTSTRFEADMLRGVSLDDQWLAFRGGVTHLVGGFSDTFYGCTTADGGQTDPWHYGAIPVSANEAWLVGYQRSVCKWTPSTGLVEVLPLVSSPNTVLVDAYKKANGELIIAGGERDPSNNAWCVAMLSDGTPLTVPPILDTTYGDGCPSIDGAGDTVYMLSRDNDTRHGQILKQQSDGSFAVVYTAPFTLSKLDVTPQGQVWAVGDSNQKAVFYDGGAWGLVGLVTTALRGNVVWQNVAALPEGVVLAGYEDERDGGRAAIANTYRFGH